MDSSVALNQLYSDFSEALIKLQSGLQREKIRLSEERREFEEEKRIWREKIAQESNQLTLTRSQSSHSIETFVDDKLDVNNRSHGIDIINNGKEALHNAGKDNHEFVLGSREFSEGRTCWTLKLEYMAKNEWVFIGIQDCATILEAHKPHSFNSIGCYGWSSQGQYSDGVMNTKTGTDLELQFEEGDVINLILDLTASCLEIRNARYNDKKFFMNIPEGHKWKLHVNLYMLGDRIQLVHTTTKQSLAQ